MNHPPFKRLFDKAFGENGKGEKVVEAKLSRACFIMITDPGIIEKLKPHTEAVQMTLVRRPRTAT